MLCQNNRINYACNFHCFSFGGYIFAKQATPGWPHMENAFSGLDVVFPSKGGGKRPVGGFRGGWSLSHKRFDLTPWLNLPKILLPFAFPGGRLENPYLCNAGGGQEPPCYLQRPAGSASLPVPSTRLLPAAHKSPGLCPLVHGSVGPGEGLPLCCRAQKIRCPDSAMTTFPGWLKSPQGLPVGRMGILHIHEHWNKQCSWPTEKLP